MGHNVEFGLNLFNFLNLSILLLLLFIEINVSKRFVTYLVDVTLSILSPEFCRQTLQELSFHTHTHRVIKCNLLHKNKMSRMVIENLYHHKTSRMQ